MDLIDKTIRTIEISIFLDSPITLLFPGLLRLCKDGPDSATSGIRSPMKSHAASKFCNRGMSGEHTSV